MVLKSFQILLIVIVSGVSIRFFQKLIQGKTHLRDIPSVKKRERSKAPLRQRLAVTTAVYACVFAIWAWLLLRVLAII